MINLIFAVLLFLPIAQAGVPNVETAASTDPEFFVQVCHAIDTCGEPVDAGITLLVTNETHPTVASTDDGAFIPYTQIFAVPITDTVHVEDVPGGMFDVIAIAADGTESLPVNPIVTGGREQQLAFNVILPR